MDNGHKIGRMVGRTDGQGICGYMRFDSDDKGNLLTLLNAHPVIVNGGTVELFEMPIS